MSSFGRRESMPDEKVSEESEFPYKETSEAVLGPGSACGSLNIRGSREGARRTLHDLPR